MKFKNYSRKVSAPTKTQQIVGLLKNMSKEPTEDTVARACETLRIDYTSQLLARVKKGW